MARFLFSSAVLALLASLFLAASPAQAQSGSLADVTISTDYPSITVQAGKNVKFPVRFTNNGTVDRELDVTLSGPENWKPQLKNQSFLVRRVYLAAGKNLTVDFTVDPPASATAGDYTFMITGTEPRGAGEAVLNLNIAVADTGPSGVRLVSQYPNLRGGADKPFEFKVDLINQSDEDRDFTLAARAPEGWEVTFQPAFEKRQISGIRLKAGETKGLDIQVTPTRTARAGEYPILVAAASGPDQAQVQLGVAVTGNYRMTVGTPPPGTLNAQATAGEETSVTMNVQNTGSGDLTNVSLSATKPDGWDVTFRPESIDRVPPGTTREVVMAIKPSNRAIPGDYMVRVTASNAQVNEQTGVRVTVSTPTTWGLVGLGIVALSIGGLYGVFRRFSRR
jgi:uncharacterized membrane protein